MSYYATGVGCLPTAKIKARNKIWDVVDVRFLTRVYLDKEGVYDWEDDYIFLDYELDNKHDIGCIEFTNEELIIENEKDIEWKDIQIDYERDYDEERDEKLIQEWGNE